MKQELKKILLNNLPVKIISIILGYSFWYIVSQSHVTEIWLDVPVCFYATEKNMHIDAPEKVRIQLSGKRIDLYTLDREHLAFHIDMQDNLTGKKIVQLTDQQLLLPNTIRLARCKPAYITITTKEAVETT